MYTYMCVCALARACVCVCVLFELRRDQLLIFPGGTSVIRHAIHDVISPLLNLTKENMATGHVLSAPILLFLFSFFFFFYFLSTLPFRPRAVFLVLISTIRPLISTVAAIHSSVLISRRIKLFIVREARKK